jgi:HlyD family secretion protein
VVERQNELNILQRDRSRFTDIERRSYDEQARAIAERIRQNEARRASLLRSLETRRARVAANDRLAASGLVGALAVQESRDALEEIQRELSATDSAAQQLQQELATLEHQHLDGLRERSREVDLAAARRRELDYVGSRSVIRAPSAGVVDEVLVRSGDFVPAQAPVVRLIPEHSRFRLTALLPQERRSSVREGDVASVALDEYPSQIYGTLSARVVHIAGDIAAPADLPAPLAAEAAASSFRAELELLPPPPSMTIHSGMMATVRFKR